MILGFKEQFKAPILAGTKIHTIRADVKDRWQTGMRIHMATGVRTKHYECFCDAHKVVSMQEVEMYAYKNDIAVYVEGKDGLCPLPTGVLMRLAYSDGFNSLDEFKEWFLPVVAKADGVWKGKIIHWSDYRY